ncbi:RrF2 family transcriptional regulator [Nitrospira lenta]|uniref:Transcriptional regulator, BadM/Rrf2 family n=1 Tax=Nitrospira lenta TaxID=1436998 RepID=A0A330L5B0_9BACT|nr:Rrf2 family transcriptional regulator [Nitrospira lenta]SPP64150.1 Transcriptional regulator, BadM/Rrf2 family [Nitrospira lenta]
MALYASSVEYGLHCLLFLVGRSGPAKTSVADLAQLQGLSPSFVAKLFTKLKKAGLVIANEGAGGGYELARPAERITVWNVVEALEGKKALFKCTEIRQSCALFGSSPPAWATKGVCSIQAVMQEAEGRMRETLRAHTLADLASRVERKAPNEFLVGVNAWFERSKK